MIPKIIHYCWFGGGNMPKLSANCIKSWRKYLPDYELRLWNEESFDINCSEYANEAYKSKKYAFVSDYVRLYALYNYGGIYMDTDVEVIRNIDQFLSTPAFSGFETKMHIHTGIMGSCQYGYWVKELLDYYNDLHFILADGSLNTVSNAITISRIMYEGGFNFDNTLQNYKGLITIYPSDYFCPKSFDTGQIKLTENSFCIHHFAGSWISNSKKIKKLVAKMIGEKNLKLILDLKHLINHDIK
jgi:mannosyltransferase OCH1-like enzyme